MRNRECSAHRPSKQIFASSCVWHLSAGSGKVTFAQNSSRSDASERSKGGIGKGLLHVALHNPRDLLAHTARPPCSHCSPLLRSHALYLPASFPLPVPSTQPCHPLGSRGARLSGGSPRAGVGNRRASAMREVPISVGLRISLPMDSESEHLSLRYST